MSFQLGQQFQALNDLREFIQQYQSTHHYKLYVRDAKTLLNKKLVPNIVAKANKELKYYSIVYGCSRGGKNFKSKSIGLRRKCSLKQGCEFKLRFALSEDSQFLVLAEMNTAHNHPNNETLAPKRQRKVPKRFDNFDTSDSISIPKPTSTAVERVSHENLEIKVEPEVILDCQEEENILTQSENPNIMPHIRPDHIESQKMYKTSVQGNLQGALKRCRLCLNYFPKVINIFREDLPKMLEILTSLKMDPTDTRFPNVACLQCAKDVKNAISIRKRIIHSQKTLIEEFKNQILQCIIEADPHPQYSDHCEEITCNVDQQISSHPQLINDPNVVYEVEIEAVPVCPNNTIGEDPDTVEASKTQEIMQKFKPIRPSTAARRTMQTAVFLEKSLNNTNNNVKRMKGLLSPGVVMKKDVPILSLAKRKQILAEYQRKKEIEKQIKKEKETVGVPQKSGRRKPYNPLMTSKIRQRLVAIKQQQTEVFPKNEKLPCNVCQKIVLGRNMIKHMEVHSNEPIKCTLCDAVCKNGNSLQSHIFYYHKCKSDEFVCEECGKAFRFKYKFMLHKKIHHGGEKDHECQHCGKKFFTNVPLLKHIKAVHKKIKSHFCEYCGKGFQSKYGLRTHVRVHTLEAPYQCTYCDECFRQKVSLRNHLKTKHNMEESSIVFCETCGKGFSSDVALASHVRKLHEVQKCPQCSETFASAEYLNKHLQAVHGEGEVVEGYGGRNDDQQCPLCSKVFANYDVLNNHMENMHGVSNMTLNINKSGEKTTMTLSDFI